VPAETTLDMLMNLNFDEKVPEPQVNQTV